MLYKIYYSQESKENKSKKACMNNKCTEKGTKKCSAKVNK